MNDRLHASQHSIAAIAVATRIYEIDALILRLRSPYGAAIVQLRLPRTLLAPRPGDGELDTLLPALTAHRQGWKALRWLSPALRGSGAGC
eukprot:7362405-Alexandrium_andersonii.AAC.1